MKPCTIVLAIAVWAGSACAGVVVHPAPDGETLSTEYQVRAGGKAVPVYGARVLDAPFAGKEYDYGGPYSFANFDTEGPVEVRVTGKKSMRGVVVRPEVPGLKVTVQDDHTVVLSLPHPCKVSVEPDGKKGPLLLFANPPEAAPPKAGDPGIIYFGPGVHQAGRIAVTNGQTLYLAGGAVVKGGVAAAGTDIRIAGRGILDSSDYEWRKGPTPHVVSIRGTNVEVSGITIRGPSHWTIVPYSSRNITIRDVKICGSRVQNDDGINPCNSQDVLITDCFIRTDDDCVAMKGLNQQDGNVQRVTVQNTVLWCDRARIFLLGHESRAPFMKDIVLRNLDIIHFTMTAFLFEPGEEMRLENVLIEDVRMHGEGQNELIRLKPVVNQYMRTKVPGHVADIRFRDLVLTGRPGRYSVELTGADESHRVRDVAFENVIVVGEPLSKSSQRYRAGQHVSEVAFRTNKLVLSTQSPGGEFAGWRSFHEEPGKKTADVWSLKPDGTLHCAGKPRGYLYTELEVADPVVCVDWRYPAGVTNSNGGVLVRMTGDHAVWPKCLEYQLNLGQAGDYWGIRGFQFTGPAERFRTIESSPHGVLRNLKASPGAEKPPGYWNSLEGRVTGSTSRQFVNDVLVNEASECDVVAGRVLLTSEGQEIHFRNLRVYY